MLPGDTIALWGPADRLAVDSVSPATRDSNCEKCELHANVDAGLRCIKPGIVGSEGPVLLVVGAWPTVYEAEVGEPFLGAVGRGIRKTVAVNWNGRVVYDFAVKCPALSAKATASWYSGCRPYLARTNQFYNYDRVILVGREACKAYLGRSVDVDGVEHPWAWSTELDAPIFMVPGIKSALANRDTERHMHEAIARACSLGRPKRPPFDAKGRRYGAHLEAELDAWAAGAVELVVDVETEGRVYDNDFRLVSVAVGREGSDLVWLWNREDCVFGTPEAETLADLLSSRPMVAHNRNYETQAGLKTLGVVAPVGGICTMLGYKLLRGNAFVSLESLQDVVGMGGSKDELAPLLSAARGEIRAEAERDALASDDPQAYRKRDPRDKPDTYAYGRVKPTPLARYNARDTLTTTYLRAWEREQLALVHGGVFQRTWDEHVGPLAEVCSYMERVGLRAERGHARGLQSYFGTRIATLQAELLDWADINWGSSKQVAEVLYDGFGLPVPWRTEGGSPSVDKYALAKLALMHDAPGVLLKQRRAQTLSNTYAWGIERFIQDDGRVHTSFKIHGTETARQSCVAEWTPVETKRGVVPIRDVCVGDYVWTHRARWRSVLRSFTKGLEEMFDIHLDNGHVLTCTREHRLLSTSGEWITVGEVMDGRLNEVGDERGERQKCVDIIQERGRDDDASDRRHDADAARQCVARPEDAPDERGAQGAGEAPVPGVEDGGQEPDEREDRAGMAAVERGVRRRVRVPDDPQFQRREGVRPSSCDGEIAWSRAYPVELVGSSHRRGQEEQRLEQLGCDDEVGAQSTAPSVQVKYVTRKGYFEVYDLTVDEDASYNSCGVYHHNSSSPNQTNMPRSTDPDGKLVKDLYIASKGRKFIVFDHATLEIRIAAGVSNDDKMLRLLASGADFHLMTAKIIAPIFGLDPHVLMKEHWLRDAAKTLAFALLYGKSDNSAADDLDVEIAVATQVRESILGEFSGLRTWIDDEHRRVRIDGGTWVYRSGGVRSRFRPLPGIFSKSKKERAKALRQSVNTRVQGGGAEVNNGGLIKCYRWLRDNPIGRHVSMPLAVHDSIVFDAADEACDEVLDVVPRLMTSFDVGAPLAIDAAIGEKMGSCEKVKVRA